MSGKRGRSTARTGYSRRDAETQRNRGEEKIHAHAGDEWGALGRCACCGGCAVVESDQGDADAADSGTGCGLSERKAHRCRWRISRARQRRERRVRQTSQLRLRSVSRQPERHGSRRHKVLSRPCQHSRGAGWRGHRHAPQCLRTSRSAGRRQERSAYLVPSVLRPRECVGGGNAGVRESRHPVHRGRMPADVL